MTQTLTARKIHYHSSAGHGIIDKVVETYHDHTKRVWMRFTSGARKGSIARVVPATADLSDTTDWPNLEENSNAWQRSYYGKYSYANSLIDLHFGNGRMVRNQYIRDLNLELLENYEGTGEYIFTRKPKDEVVEIPDKFDRFGKKLSIGDSVMYPDNKAIMFGKVTKISPAGTVVVTPTKITEKDDSYALGKKRQSSDSSIFIIVDGELVNRVLLAKLAI